MSTLLLMLVDQRLCWRVRIARSLSRARRMTAATVSTSAQSYAECDPA